MTGRLRIGFPSERIVYMLPLLLKPLKDRYPGIDVEVSTGPGNQLIADLKAGNVDFVFLPYWTPLKDIVQVEVSQEELVLVAAKEYLNESCFLDRGKKIINWKEAAKLPLDVYKRQLPGYGKVALAAMVPLFSRMGHFPYQVPTAVVSNTLDFGKFRIQDMTDYMRDTIKVWDELGFDPDCICTGFVLSEEQVELIGDYIRSRKPRRSETCLLYTSRCV